MFLPSKYTGADIYFSPGRFFAATEFTLMFAHILINYDVKMAEGGLPATTWVASASMPDTKAKIMFRKRQ